MVWVRMRDSVFLKEWTRGTVFNPYSTSLLSLFLWTNSLLLFLRLGSLLPGSWQIFSLKTGCNRQCWEVQWSGKEASLRTLFLSHLQSVPHKQLAHLFFSLLDLLSSVGIPGKLFQLPSSRQGGPSTLRAQTQNWSQCHPP